MGSQRMPILLLRDIHKRFGATVALDGVDLELEPGEIHALIGENGAGKSTLMNILAGALHPDQGEMELEQAPYRPQTPLEARRHGISLIHQELSLCPHLSVWENILLGVESSRWGWLDLESCRRRTEQVLTHFSHPELRPERPVGELSIAARQVVEICRALAFQARILLMDEPTSSLPRSDVQHLFALIRRLRSQGISVIYISHFLEEVREVADRFTVLRDGRSVATGSLQGISDQELIAHMVGRPVENLFPARGRRERGEVVLKVRDLRVRPAVERASFELHRGEILGISGLMGSGRTALIRALFGLQPVSGGEIWIAELPASFPRNTPRQRIQEGLGYLSEDRKEEGLALALSVADNITMTRYSTCSRAGWLNQELQRRQAWHWVQTMGIRAQSPSQPAGTLSGGNQQKTALARLLHQEASVLLLDEPTRGIDIGSKVQIYQVIARLAQEGKGVLMVSSYLPELFGLCDRLAVMSRGRLLPARPIQEWTPETVLQAAIGKGSDS